MKSIQEVNDRVYTVLVRIGIHCTQIVSEIYMQRMGVVIRFQVPIEMHSAIVSNYYPESTCPTSLTKYHP